ncbi:hypothetical protein K488DRAFT_30415, partial [Vararia minispora EC-137]
VAAKFHVSFEALKPSANLRHLLPAWFHFGSIDPARRLRDGSTARCLRQNHRVQRMADLFEISARIRNQVPGEAFPHQEHASCDCLACLIDREPNGIIRCKAPHRCAKAALTLLRELSGTRWDPLADFESKDGLTLTPRRLEHNSRVADERNGEVTFDPSVSSKDLPQASFRIFTSSDRRVNEPA